MEPVIKRAFTLSPVIEGVVLFESLTPSKTKAGDFYPRKTSRVIAGAAAGGGNDNFTQIFA
jgi:tripartite-type tricarboxylate transporter receptor subunit TctC